MPPLRLIASTCLLIVSMAELFPVQAQVAEPNQESNVTAEGQDQSGAAPPQAPETTDVNTNGGDGNAAQEQNPVRQWIEHATTDPIVDILANKKTLIVFGKIRYRDQFQWWRTRYTNFCFQLDPGATPHVSFGFVLTPDSFNDAT